MKVVSSKRAPQAIGPYSQGVEVNGFIYLSGQIALNGSTGEMIQDSFENECKQVFQNISYMLEDNGLNFSNVVKVNISILDMDKFSILNDIYATYFKAPFPARACVAVKSLPKNGNVEIEVIAAR
ncbi:MAG: Rid family detoxifying hydrolase [Candidatus Cloacimonetes bacterium]|nr:Rid family detoxifying hydrolase [Candidatus Cloacimonadota bacterium]